MDKAVRSGLQDYHLERLTLTTNARRLRKRARRAAASKFLVSQKNSKKKAHPLVTGPKLAKIPRALPSHTAADAAESPPAREGPTMDENQSAP
jgi:hypothetical protein